MALRIFKDSAKETELKIGQTISLNLTATR